MEILHTWSPSPTEPHAYVDILLVLMIPDSNFHLSLADWSDSYSELKKPPDFINCCLLNKSEATKNDPSLLCLVFVSHSTGLSQ